MSRGPDRRCLLSSATPDLEAPERVQQRRFSAARKAQIALLRREGLYSSLINEWGKRRDHPALQAMAESQGAGCRVSQHLLASVHVATLAAKSARTWAGNETVQAP